MASVKRDPRSKIFHVRFRFGGRSFHRSLETRDGKDAAAARVRVEDTIRHLGRGWLDLPLGLDAGDFILSGGKLKQATAPQEPLTLEDLFARYHRELPADAKEENTTTTEKIHCKHLLRILDRKKTAQSISPSDMQSYCNARSKEEGRRGKVRPQTIKKELATFRVIWNWATRLGLLTGPAPTRGIQLAKAGEQSPFQTVEEIQKIIDRRGLSRLMRKGSFGTAPFSRKNRSANSLK